MCQEINVPVTIPRSLYMFIHKLLDKSIIIKHTLQMKKSRHRKKKSLQDHTTSKWQRYDLNPGSLVRATLQQLLVLPVPNPGRRGALTKKRKGKRKLRT